MKHILHIFRKDVTGLSRNLFALMIAGGLCIIPSLYAWFNTLSNWDPYGTESTSRIKVAVASDDPGVTIDGVTVNIGDQIISNLKANTTIGWVFTDSTQEAIDGVYSGDYYAALVLPSDFTSDMVSFLSDSLEHPQIQYYCNQKKNAIAPKITDKAKGIVIINPNNPTGALYPKEILEQIVELAREHELLIFADEIYDRLVMDGKQHISIASLAPDLCVVSFNGLSKSHLIAGYRCGWMCISGDKSRAKGYIEGINLLSSMRLCANVPTQSVIPKALEMLDSTKEMLEPGGRVYEQREYIYNALNDIPGVSAVKPEAAFYIFPKMDMKKFHIKDDEKFALDFLKEKKILVTHGGGFHWNTPDHFRIVYLPDVDTLTEACTRMKDFFAHYVQD